METERSNRVISADINASVGEIKFVVKGAGEVVFHAGRVHQNNRTYAEFHGWKQRLVDDAAGEKTPQGKLAAIQGLVSHYESGADHWNVKRSTRELTIEEKRAMLEKLAAELGVALA